VTAPLQLEQRLALLREAFDQAFAAVPATVTETSEDLLAVRVAGDAYALRLREITALVASRKIVPLPSRRRELLGVAGHRGSLVAVYSLAALLGYEADSKPPSWLVLARSAAPVGLAFGEFEGFLRVWSKDLHKAAPEGGSPALVEVLRVGTTTRPLVELRKVLETLEVHPGKAGSSKES
jgi:chemotaxis signal transduction protein